MHCHFDCLLIGGVGCLWLPGAVSELLEGVIALHEWLFSRECVMMLLHTLLEYVGVIANICSI